jgi:hypothetical protein
MRIVNRRKERVMSYQTVLPTTSERVPLHTDEEVNAQIRRSTLEHLDEVGTELALIDARLRALEKEWDIERAIESNAASVALIGLALGATVHKRWFVLPALVASFLLQHSIQGWCPPVPVLRRLGLRTQREIDNERAVLKARRGDFKAIVEGSSKDALRAMER